MPNEEWRTIRIPPHVHARLLNFAWPGESRGDTIQRLLDHDATCPGAQNERLQRLGQLAAAAVDPTR